jgi:hypothetical protein
MRRLLEDALAFHMVQSKQPLDTPFREMLISYVVDRVQLLVCASLIVGGSCAFLHSGVQQFLGQRVTGLMDTFKSGQKVILPETYTSCFQELRAKMRHGSELFPIIFRFGGHTYSHLYFRESPDGISIQLFKRNGNPSSVAPLCIDSSTETWHTSQEALEIWIAAASQMQSYLTQNDTLSSDQPSVFP